MKIRVQTHLFKLLSILTVASLLAATVSMFAAQPASAVGIVGTITRPGFLPKALALDETRNRLFVFDEATDTVFIYNATTLQEVGSVATTLEDSMSMVVDESAGKLYVGYFGPGVDLADGIAVINTATGALIKYLPSGGYTYLVEDEALNVVYASSIYYGVRKIDIATDNLSTVSGINANLYTGMAVNPVTHELFVSNWSQNAGNFFIVNPATLATTTIANMNGFGVAVNWNENKVYVSYCQPAGYEAVCILDRDTNTRTDVHTTNDSTQPMVFNPSVNRMYTNTEVNRITTVFNGSTDAFTNIELTSALSTVDVRHSTDNVYYIDAAGTYVMKGSTGKIVAEFPVGGDCSVCDGAIVINQTSGLVYVINDDSVGKVTVIQDGIFTAPSCIVTPLAGAGTTSGALTSVDCHSPLRNETSYWDPYFADRYSINLTAGQQVSIVLEGGEAYEYLYLLDPSGNILTEASGNYSSAARIPGSGLFTVSVSGTYMIEVTSVYSGLESGSFVDSEWPYTLTLTTTNAASQTLTVNKTGTGNGTVTSSPTGVNCGADCSEAYAYNTSVTLTASPAAGSTFTGWSGDCSGTGSCIVSMTTTRSVTATFTTQTSNASVDIYIGGLWKGNYAVPSSPSLIVNNPDTLDGPVTAINSKPGNIITSQRVYYGNSFNELMGYPSNQFTTEYWFPWYDQVYMQTWILVGNPSTNQTAYVDIYIGGSKWADTTGTVQTYAIPPGDRVTPVFPGVLDGPVKVVSVSGPGTATPINIFASERSLFGDSFNEVMGYPGNNFTTEYWFPWYDQVYMNTWILVGNPSTTQTAYVAIYIGGSKRADTTGTVQTYAIPPNGNITPQFPGVLDGAVKVVSVSGPGTTTPIDIFASERSTYGTSFNEVMGYSASKFTTEYYYTWYDNTGMASWILVGNPSATQTAYVDIYIGGSKQADTTGTVQTYAIPPSGNVTPQFALNTGPVRVVSVTGDGTPTPIKIFTSERSVYRTSFNEMMGYPASQLTAEYWFTWYDSIYMNTEIYVAKP